jgi:uncharacterized membrane protein
VSGSQSGQVSVFVIGVALICFAIAGVAVDGTRAFLYRRTLQNAADAAALAGASEIDSRAYYSNREEVVLDDAGARAAALEWLARRGLAVSADISATPVLVRVGLSARLNTTFLGLVGIADLPVAAEATAEPLSGPP